MFKNVVKQHRDTRKLYFCGTAGYEPPAAPAPTAPAWQGRSIGTSKLRLVEFSAFLEQQRDPDSVSRGIDSILFVMVGILTSHSVFSSMYRGSIFSGRQSAACRLTHLTVEKVDFRDTH